MFLLAATRSPLLRRVGTLETQAAEVGDWHITTATDGTWSHTWLDGARRRVREAVAFDEGGGQLAFADAMYDPAASAIEVDHHFISGKALYYHRNADGEFFVSTHIALLRDAGVSLEEDRDRLPEFFIYRFITAPLTLFRGVRRLPRGSRLRVELTGQGCDLHESAPYVPHVDSQAPTERDGAARGSRDRVLAAVDQLRPVADRVSVLLSGGVDSSLLFRSAQRELGVSDSFAAGFPFETPKENEERQYSQSAAAAFGARHHYFEPTTEEYLRGVVTAIAATEEPLHHLQTVLLHLLFASDELGGQRVVICGDGADNLFGLSLHRWIQRWNRQPLLFGLASSAPVQPLLTAALRAMNRGGTFRDVLASRVSPNDIGHPMHVTWQADMSGSLSWVERHLHSTMHDVIANPVESLRPYGPHNTADMLALRSMTGDTLATQGLWSKVGEAAGHILHYPFNDAALTDYAFSLPWSLKSDPPKLVLRDAARLLDVPDFVLSRPKRGFGVRPERWALPGGVFEPLLSLAAAVYDERELRDLQTPEPLTAFTLWNAINHAIWRRLWIDGEPTDRLLGELDEAIGRRRLLAAS